MSVHVHVELAENIKGFSFDYDNDYSPRRVRSDSKSVTSSTVWLLKIRHL